MRNTLLQLLLGILCSQSLLAGEVGTAVSEATIVAQIRNGKMVGDPQFAAAVRRVLACGGTFEFDKAGQLIGVDLAGDRVSATDAEVVALSALPNLQRLRLSGGGITATGIRKLCAFASLTDLFLLDAHVDNVAFGQLAKLANLRSLRIRRSPELNDEGVRQVVAFPKLDDIGLLEVAITDKSLAVLAEVGRFRSIDLRGSSQITDAGVAQLCRLKQLKVLRLGGSQITDATLQAIRGFASLGSLTMDDASITDVGISELPARLEEIQLSRCSGVSDEGLQRLGELKHLRRLSVRDMPITGGGLKPLSARRQLTSLKVRGTMIGNEFISCLHECTNMRELDLSETLISDDALKALEDMKQLRSLDVSRTGISEAGAKRLAEQLPQCKIIRE
jgi:Leucine-rich repeat (LRR) protein